MTTSLRTRLKLAAAAASLAAGAFGLLATSSPGHAIAPRRPSAPSALPWSFTPSLTLTGQTSATYLGNAMARAGDVNGDGYPDVIIGAEGYGSSRGQAYVHLGSPAGLAAAPISTLSGESVNSLFGFTVDGAGDVNHDGYSDVVAGAFAYSGGLGRVYLYTGSPAGVHLTPALTLTGRSTLEQFGAALSGGGDINGDGNPDLIVGARGYLTNTGRAYVYLGGPAGMSASPAVTFTGAASGDWLGNSVNIAGDINHDGFADVLISSDRALSNTGRVYVYAGSAGGLNSTPNLTLTGENSGDYFGYFAVGAGDVNNDSYADVLIGSDGYLSNTGRAYLYLGGPLGITATPALTLTGAVTQAHFGSFVSAAGDVDGDGFGDALIGAYGTLSDTGRAFLYLGGPTGLSPTPVYTFTGETHDDAFGRWITSAGDVNLDGYSDFVIGAKHYPSNVRTGRAYFYKGHAAPGVATLTPVATPAPATATPPASSTPPSNPTATSAPKPTSTAPNAANVYLPAVMR